MIEVDVVPDDDLGPIKMMVPAGELIKLVPADASKDIVLSVASVEMG